MRTWLYDPGRLGGKAAEGETRQARQGGRVSRLQLSRSRRKAAATCMKLVASDPLVAESTVTSVAHLSVSPQPPRSGTSQVTFPQQSEGRVSPHVPASHDH